MDDIATVKTTRLEQGNSPVEEPESPIEPVSDDAPASEPESDKVGESASLDLTPEEIKAAVAYKKARDKQQERNDAEGKAMEACQQEIQVILTKWGFALTVDTQPRVGLMRPKGQHPV